MNLLIFFPEFKDRFEKFKLKYENDKLSNDFYEMVKGKPDQQLRGLRDFASKYGLNRCPVCNALNNQLHQCIIQFYKPNFWSMNNVSLQDDPLLCALGALSASMNVNKRDQDVLKKVCYLSTYVVRFVSDAIKDVNNNDNSNTIIVHFKDEDFMDNLVNKAINRIEIEELYDEAEKLSNEKKVNKLLTTINGRREQLRNINSISNEDKKEEISVNKINDEPFDLDPNTYIKVDSGSKEEIVLLGQNIPVNQIVMRRPYELTKVTEFVEKSKDDLKGILTNEQLTSLDFIPSRARNDIYKIFRNQNQLNTKNIKFYQGDEIDKEKFGYKTNYEVVYSIKGKEKTHVIIPSGNFLGKNEEDCIMFTYNLPGKGDMRVIVVAKDIHEVRDKKKRKNVLKYNVKYLLCHHYDVKQPWYELDLNS